MATTKINIGGVLGGSRSITSAKTTVTNVKSSFNSTRNQIDYKIMNRNNLNNRFANVSTRLGAVESKISRINTTVNNCVNQYNNTEQDVLKNGKDVAETFKSQNKIPVFAFSGVSPILEQFENYKRDKDKEKKNIVDIVFDINKKAQEVVEEIHALKVEEEARQNETLYAYGEVDYLSIAHFSQYAMKQDLNIGNCTAVAWCMGMSMYKGEKHDPSSPNYWNPNTGAIYTGYSQVVKTNQFATMYNELSQGKPVMFYAYNGNSISGYHAVTIVGISESADAANLSANDFLCIDPTDGNIKRVSEVGYHNYNGTVYTYA